MSQSRSPIPLVLAIVLLLGAGFCAYRMNELLGMASQAASRVERSAADAPSAGEDPARAAARMKQSADRAAIAGRDADEHRRNAFVVGGIGGALLLVAVTLLLRQRRPRA